ncbi:linear gramicidin synthetase subunit D domain protein [Mycobacterium xenopi 4042]|uniref:Linear gramicidin synthetase subunit D domain protein n=1 Tax=Mycobacterium xenopi 4042 TaxID=1299334 RepID=X8E5N0_MYCXE|nr:linear gramicidin synthetase subunit D domain protein [Mycobacterium xenopi 4042]
MVLDALPLTVNGKLDTPALPPRNTVTPTTTGPDRRGRGDPGRIYAEMLGLQAGRVDDSFFDLAATASCRCRWRRAPVPRLCEAARCFRRADRGPAGSGGSGGRGGRWRVDEGIGQLRPPRSCAGCAAWAARSSSSTRRWWCRRRRGHRHRRRGGVAGVAGPARDVAGTGR